jgi:hypothetical protein
MGKHRGNKKGQEEKSDNEKEEGTPEKGNRNKKRQPKTPEKETKKKKTNQYKNLRQQALDQETDRVKEDGKNQPSEDIIFDRNMEDDKLSEVDNLREDDNLSMEEGQDDETVAANNINVEEDDNGVAWTKVYRKQRNPYQKQHVARDLPAPKFRDCGKEQRRTNFCLTIEAGETKQETEENANAAVNKLAKILVKTGAQILPWKEAKFEKNLVVNKETEQKFIDLPYPEKRKLYVDSGYVKASSTKVYLYLYLGIPKSYASYRDRVERALKEVDIVWFKHTLQAERRLEIGYVRGSHPKVDTQRVIDIISRKTNLQVNARWRYWGLPKHLQTPGEDDKVFALWLETNAEYTSQERKLIFRLFGKDSELRKEIGKAFETTLEIQLIPSKLGALSDISVAQAVLQRRIQREINSKTRDMAMFRTVMIDINKEVPGGEGLTLRELILTTKQKNSDTKYLFISVDQPSGFDSPILTFMDGLQQEVERFIEGARIIMEANARIYFGKDLDLADVFTVQANNNYAGQQFDERTKQYITMEDQHLQQLAQVSIEWAEYSENPLDPSKWTWDDTFDEYSMATRQTDDYSIFTEYSNRTEFPDELSQCQMEMDHDELLTQYTAADDRDSGASARKN